MASARLPWQTPRHDGQCWISTIMIAARAARTLALIKKETRQILRDPGSITVGMILPVVLILLFGFGLSLDVKHVPGAVVLEDASPDAAELASVFELSPYFHVPDGAFYGIGQRVILERQVDGIIRIRPDFARRMRNGDALVQVVVHGGDANRAGSYKTMQQGPSTNGRRAQRRRTGYRCNPSLSSSGFGSTRRMRAATSSSWSGRARNDRPRRLIDRVGGSTRMGAGNVRALFVTPSVPAKSCLAK